MRYDLKDKVMIITGANSGIGKAASVQLARCGAAVVVTCRDDHSGTTACGDGSSHRRAALERPSTVALVLVGLPLTLQQAIKADITSEAKQLASKV